MLKLFKSKSISVKRLDDSLFSMGSGIHNLSLLSRSLDGISKKIDKPEVLSDLIAAGTLLISAINDFQACFEGLEKLKEVD